MPENVVKLNLDFWFKPLNQAETVWNGQKLKAENRQLALENQSLIAETKIYNPVAKK